MDTGDMVQAAAMVDQLTTEVAEEVPAAAVSASTEEVCDAGKTSESSSNSSVSGTCTELTSAQLAMIRGMKHKNTKKVIKQVTREGAALSPAPCTHNKWDNVRIKKGNHSLRCRDCQKQWKVHHSFFTRCGAFLKGKCDLGSRCANVHVYQYKEGLKERRGRFGNTVLEGVPTKILDAHGMAAQEAQEEARRAEALCHDSATTTPSSACLTDSSVSSPLPQPASPAGASYVLPAQQQRVGHAAVQPCQARPAAQAGVDASSLLALTQLNQCIASLAGGPLQHPDPQQLNLLSAVGQLQRLQQQQQQQQQQTEVNASMVAQLAAQVAALQLQVQQAQQSVASIQPMAALQQQAVAAAAAGAPGVNNPYAMQAAMMQQQQQQVAALQLQQQISMITANMAGLQ